MLPPLCLCEHGVADRPTEVIPIRIKIILSLVLLTPLASALPLFAGAQSQRNWCGTEDQREVLKYRVREIAREDDSTAIANAVAEATMRPAPTRVEIIADQKICERATRAYYRHTLGPLRNDGVAVARFGDKYAVFGEIRAGEWTILTIYNLQFEKLGQYGV